MMFGIVRFWTKFFKFLSQYYEENRYRIGSMVQPINLLHNMFAWLCGFIFRQPIEVPSIQDSLILCSEGHQEKNVAHDKYDDEEVIPDEECAMECGVVTMVNEHYGLIDGKFYFEHDHITLFEEGMAVNYYSYQKNGQKKINRVIEPIESDSNESEEIFHKKLVVQVVKRHEREIFVQPNSLSFVLNEVIYTFIPAVGDWLEIECIVEIDENEKNLAGDVLKIVRIDSLRSMTIVGEIEQYDILSGIGVIQNEISFNKTSCTPGYMPRIGDIVSADVIESEQKNCSWRALNVTPENIYHHQPHDVPRNLPDMDDIHYGDKGNIVVSKMTRVKLQDIGETTRIEIRANNRNTASYEIVGVEIMSTESQLSLIYPQCPPNMILAPHDTVTFTFQCDGKFMGTTKELIILNFVEFKIGRWVNITVGNSVIQNGYSIRNNQTHNTSLAEAARKTFFAGEKNLVIGQRLCRPPAFIVNKLPLYEVPERFAKKVFRELEANSEHVAKTKIENIAPFLLQELNVKNYKDILHSVLYVEELTVQVYMRRYDVQRAKFDSCGAHFRLEVPNLMERRPSIVIGDRVIATNPNEPAGHRFEGYVHRTTNKCIYLGFHPQFHAAYAGEDFSIEFHASRTNFRRYHHAVNLAMKLLRPEFLFPVSVPKRKPQIEFVVESLLLRRLKRFEDEQRKLEEESNKKSGNFTKKFNAILTNTKSTKKKVLFWFDRTLNEFQKLAVKNIIIGEARPLPYLLFGPPGTGKTVTLIETILQIHQLIPHSRILVIGPSNAAADLIALRLLDSKVLLPGDLVRMVAYRCVVDKTIPERLIPYSMTGDIAREGTRESKERIENGVRMCVGASAVGRNRIIIATCAVVGTLYTMGFAPGHFTHIILDEAGQISEPETMIPLSLLDVNTAQTILAGDPLQLGPCIFSELARTYGLGQSYFERMIKCTLYNRDPIGFPKTGGYDPRLVTRLVYNYRSLPEILALSNDLFYDSELRPKISSTEGTEVDLLKQVRHVLPKRQVFDNDEEDDNDTEPLPPAVVFHGVRGHNLQAPDSPSWFNPTEAGQVLHYLTEFYEAGLEPEDIGIITPYTKQCAHLRELCHQVHLKLPKIGSVEEFQGQEYKVVIMSTVRSNEDGAHADGRHGLGFISSPRRLNVAVSRAQALLIIIGNPHLLITDHYWRSVIMYAVNLGGYRGCNLPNI